MLMRPIGIAPSKARQIREEKGLTRIALAVRAGVGEETLRLLELGLASEATRAKVAAVLKCKPADLIGPASK